MNWFKKILGVVSGEAPKDFVFVPRISRPGTVATAILPDETYIELFVDSLRIDKARSFATRFHGVVYTFESLAKLAEDGADFAAVTKPDKLAELDKDSVDRIIAVSKQMLGPVPWRGGSFELQLGLFAIKSGNLLTPLLNFVTKVSDAAGIGFIGAVKPFLPLITEGMDLIAGQTEDTKLVVGIDTAMQLDSTTTCAIIAKQKHEIDVATLSIDPADGKLLIGNAPLDAAYCVFSIRATDRKPDFGEIPELKESYAEFRKAVVAGKQTDAREACNAFCRRTLTSPDLITKDAARLIALARQVMADAFGTDPAPTVAEPGAGPAIISRGGRAQIPATLGELALY
jgi:hypothetical protein